MYKALGPAWHKGDRQRGLVPVGLRNVDTQSTWSKSGYCGWVQGYRLLLQGLAFPEPVPIFAAWRPNNEHEAKLAIEALGAGGLKVTDVLLPRRDLRRRLVPLSLRGGRRLGPLTQATA